MSYRIKVSREAQAEIKDLPGHVRAQIRQIVKALQGEPRPYRARELRGASGIYRLWVEARWRFVYAVDDDDQIIQILRARLKEAIDYASLVETPDSPASDTPERS